MSAPEVVEVELVEPPVTGVTITFDGCTWHLPLQPRYGRPRGAVTEGVREVLKALLTAAYADVVALPTEEAR